MKEFEGVIKYRLDYSPGALPAGLDPAGLFDWFRRCRRLGLIGRDPQRYGGAAYGNISRRVGRGFVISATQTGGRPHLGRDDLAWVTDFDPPANRLSATGPAPPSSEAMTHGQVYRALPAVDAVIHVHSPLIWRRAASLGLPRTAPSAAYGTPAMAAEVARLLTGTTADAGVFVMGGHEDGVVAYGGDMDRAGERLLAVLADAGMAEDMPDPAD